MTFEEWSARYPEAAAELGGVLSGLPWPNSAEHTSEAAAQQSVRLQLAHAGAMGWRNNVGATPSKCPDCGAPRAPIRFGLANDSAKLNERVKSSDIIAAIPRIITADQVGKRIAQFGSIEVKPPGWTYTGKGREAGQAAWLALITRLGGYACFSAGDINL
jgi:hypothetical protein